MNRNVPRRPETSRSKSSSFLPLLIPWVCLALFLSGCGPDLSTPEATVDHAGELLKQKKWEPLYQLLHPERTVITDGDLRRVMTFVQREFPDKDLPDLLRLSPAERFALLLEALHQAPETREFMQAYRTAKFEVTSRDDTSAIITVESNGSLPAEKFELQPYEGRWLIYNFEAKRKYF